MPEPLIQSISDTARWVACFRARETQRESPLFKDPYAEALAGPRGFEILATLTDGNKHEWAWVARTYLFDQLIFQSLGKGTHCVLNLGAGLDARPYRMQLPPALEWVEVDLPELIDYKEHLLQDAKPKCSLTRVALDLSDATARKALFTQLDSKYKRTLVISEGLLIYLSYEEVSSLATELNSTRMFCDWLIDLASPAQLRIMQRTTGRDLHDVGAPFRFAPPDGPQFFRPFGWEPKEVHGLLKTAAQFNRAPGELLCLLPEPKSIPAHYPWTGVCLLERSRHAVAGT